MIVTQTVNDRVGQGYSAGRSSSRNKAGKKKKAVLNPKEKRRFLQLVVCVLLFACLLVGSGIFPEQMQVWRQRVLQTIQTDTNFKEVFVGLGRSIAEGEPVFHSLGDLWIEAFGGKQAIPEEEAGSMDTPVYRREYLILASGASGNEMMEMRLGLDGDSISEAAYQTENVTAGWEERESVPQPALLVSQKGQENAAAILPKGCTMVHIPLALAVTAVPVTGVVSSGFGYRLHPLSGAEAFHYGVDIAAEDGEAIAAFADGVVELAGENLIYGKYVQLRHAGGITTLYAHCSKLCVKAGQQVTVGRTIAEVGQTGNATGPHLHFEVRLNGAFLNPLYYIGRVRKM